MEKNIKKQYNGMNEAYLIELLREKKLKFSVAESCTGGKISALITSVPGASDIFYEGIVTYSNESKIKRLNVNKSTIEKHGAVSYETALEMLKGLVTEFGISVTGIAGPSGGSFEKPVGTVFIGIKFKEYISVKKYFFTGMREEIQNAAVAEAVKEAIKLLE